MQDRCRVRKEEILRAHVPEPLDPALDHALEEILNAARNDLNN